jgi:putative CocE/NonD family hydrolase
MANVKRLAKRASVALLAAAVLLAGFWFVFPKTAGSLVAAGAGQFLLRYLAFRSGAGPFQDSFTLRENIPVAMRDGVHLATDVYVPASPGPHPAILIRTPYTKGEMRVAGEFFARYGYAVAVQDTRGRHKSEGEFYPFRSEPDDGLDMTRWVKRQPWCNGRIGAFGASYLGFTQWAMAAGNPDLAAISPAFITANLYRGIYSNGAFGELTFLHWSLSSYGRFGNWAGAAHIAKGYGHFPLAESDDAALRDIGFYDDWVSHPVPDSYWRQLNVDHRFSEIKTPVFLVAGWFDFFRDAEIQDFQSFERSGPAGARKNVKILIGPWSHGFFNAHLKEYGIQQKWMEAIPFEFVRETKTWLDHALKGASNGWERRPPVRVFVLGENEWRDERQWPPAGASPLSYYLHSGGKAATLAGDGSIALAPPSGSEPADAFDYDPRNPVPTVGGNHGDQWTAGPADQSAVEKRRDVLVYSSEPLAKPLLVMGMVKAKLFASSTALDTDFTAKLVDVQPDGRALILCEGVVRARYRDGLDAPQMMQPGAVYSFEIEVGNTAALFKPGHRIRLEISSSNSPRYDPNPNTGREIATERFPLPAAQRVFHTAELSSRLVLPVVSE